MTLAMVGCASFAHGEAVKDGDKVGIHFTCRLPNGEVASTTRKEVVFDKALKKSPILLTVIGDKPIEVTAGEPPHMSPLTTPGLEEEIIRQLTLYSVGMKEGEKRSVKLTAETVPVRGSEQQKLVMPRIWHRPKLVHMLKDVYRTNARKEPKVGENYSGDAPLEGKVTAVTDKEVIIAFSAKPGSTIRTAYGVGTVMEKDDRFDILIDVKPGSLIRTDLLVGKVTEVGAEDFTLDYSNPFFGETLSCDFSVMELQKEGEESPAAATPATKSKPAPMAKEEGATTSQEHTKAVAKQLESVIADAAKSGKKSVDIEVDQLPYLVAEGDLVTVQFSARNSDGTTLTLPEGAPKFDISQEVVAGKQEIFPGLGESVVGMLIGEKKEVTLPPEKAFGIHDPAKMVSIPLRTRSPPG